MKSILILTYEGDKHADYVCTELKHRNNPYFRINTDQLISKYQLTFDSRNSYYTISDSIRTETIDEKWNIWNRRVFKPDLPKDFPSDLEETVHTETQKAWEGLLCIHQGRVINRLQANFAANNKIDQGNYVKKHGVEIQCPETLLTNDPQKLLEFYTEVQPLCHKVQGGMTVQRDGQYLITYTNMVSEENLKHADLIRINPSLFQHYIEKEYELRITALQDKIIAIAIHSQDSEISKIDFRRYDFENVKYRKVEIPPEVESFCRNILQHYGLFFGEIDMIFTKEEKYVFLELNPNGQWLWLELKSGYHLTKDIVDNLILE